MTAEEIVARARLWVGTPYRHQARAVGAGCDCLGLLLDLYALAEGRLPMRVPAYGNGWRQGGMPLLEDAARRYLRPVTGALSPGDILLFAYRRDLPARHCGVLVAPDRFVHALDRVGVVETMLTPWWRRHMRLALRFPSLD